MTFEEVKAILTANGGLPPGPITPDASLARAGVDSMALVVLSLQVEDRLGLEISEDELSAAASVGGLAELIRRHAECPA
ncbi:acyl carrier protein [Streptomyces fradiae]|uniref:acyl carrier protein n=1 Tax=Streptomyces fradiae TaxID=1906 RepID=UPI0029435975|nr:acyl carrier protein [Streptomyces fradiae]WOI60996.1 acyl carrier protein [Streptomyces fradiae]